MRYTLSFTLLIALLYSGCGLLSNEDTSVEASGTVFNKSTGAPIAGLSVVMEVASGGGGGLFKGGSYRTVASARTDSAGRYRLEADLGDLNIAQVYLNEDPYDPTYYIFNYSVVAGERLDERFELYQTATLQARAEISQPLLEGDRYCLYLELVGVCESDSQVAAVTDTRAKANAYNAVRLVGSLGGKTVERADSVYCRIGELCEYVLEH